MLKAIEVITEHVNTLEWCQEKGIATSETVQLAIMFQVLIKKLDEIDQTLRGLR